MLLYKINQLKFPLTMFSEQFDIIDDFHRGLVHSINNKV